MLPCDRRLRGSKGVEAYFTLGDHTAGSVIPGLYARLLPHADIDGGNPVVLCSSSDGSDPSERADTAGNGRPPSFTHTGPFSRSLTPQVRASSSLPQSPSRSPQASAGPSRPTSSATAAAAAVTARARPHPPQQGRGRSVGVSLTSAAALPGAMMQVIERPSHCPPFIHPSPVPSEQTARSQ